MKYAIVIDSVAALPEYVLQSRPIHILPVTILIDGKEKADTTVASELKQIYASGRINSKARIDTIPPTAEQIREYMKKEIIPFYDYAICQTTSAENSPIYQAFSDVGASIAKDARELRDSLGIDHPFMMTYVNSGTSNAGQGLLAMYADVLLSRGTDYQSYKDQVEKIRHFVKGYTVVKDILYTRNRAHSLGISSVGFSRAFIGQAMGVSPITRFTRDVMTPIVLKPGFEKAVNRTCKYAIDRIRDGLLFPMVTISYGGDLKDLDDFEGVAKLRSIASKHNVKVVMGMMSLCGSINYSTGSFSLGIAPKDQDSEP